MINSFSYVNVLRLFLVDLNKYMIDFLYVFVVVVKIIKKKGYI